MVLMCLCATLQPPKGRKLLRTSSSVWCTCSGIASGHRSALRTERHCTGRSDEIAWPDDARSRIFELIKNPSKVRVCVRTGCRGPSLSLRTACVAREPRQVHCVASSLHSAMREMLRILCGVLTCHVLLPVLWQTEFRSCSMLWTSRCGHRFKHVKTRAFQSTCTT